MLLDWVVGMAFPCQRPFGHALGVAEVPKWRILPDRLSADANSPVMDTIGGGPLGISELLFQAVTVPSYLRDDWFRDWGALQRLTPLSPNATAAENALPWGCTLPLGCAPGRCGRHSLCTVGTTTILLKACLPLMVLLICSAASRGGMVLLICSAAS